jgi:hypothetical protein
MPMLRDENGHGDQDDKRDDQGGCPDAAAACGKIARTVGIGHLNEKHRHLAGCSPVVQPWRERKYSFGEKFEPGGPSRAQTATSLDLLMTEIA